MIKFKPKVYLPKTKSWGDPTIKSYRYSRWFYTRVVEDMDLNRYYRLDILFCCRDRKINCSVCCKRASSCTHNSFAYYRGNLKYV